MTVNEEMMIMAKILSRLGLLQQARLMTLPERKKVLKELSDLLKQLPQETEL